MRNRLCLILYLALISLPARSDEPTAKVAQVDGQVVIQRDADLIRLEKGKEMSVLSGDTLRTRDGTVEIKYNNGSALRIGKNTIVLFLSRSEQADASQEAGKEEATRPEEEKGTKPKPRELRIRLVVGEITASIKPAPRNEAAKTVFLLPQSRIALLRGDVQAIANAAGDWQVWLESGEAVATDSTMRLVWRVVPKQGFRVEYLPQGVRISNLPKSASPAVIQFHARGFHEIVAEQGSVELSLPGGKSVAIKEKQRVGEEIVPERTSITGLDPSEAVVVLRGKRTQGN